MVKKKKPKQHKQTQKLMKKSEVKASAKSFINKKKFKSASNFSTGEE